MMEIEMRMRLRAVETRKVLCLLDYKDENYYE